MLSNTLISAKTERTKHNKYKQQRSFEFETIHKMRTLEPNFWCTYLSKLTFYDTHFFAHLLMYHRLDTKIQKCHFLIDTLLFLFQTCPSLQYIFCAFVLSKIFCFNLFNKMFILKACQTKYFLYINILLQFLPYITRKIVSFIFLLCFSSKIWQYLTFCYVVKKIT